MSPITMAILGLLAYKAVKSFTVDTIATAGGVMAIASAADKTNLQKTIYF